MRKLMVLAVLSLTTGVASDGKALDKNDLSALRAAIHDLCVAPDKKGKYLKIEGGLLKITGVNENAKVTTEEWEGINQQLAYKTDPRECAVKMTGILAPLFQPHQAMDQNNDRSPSRSPDPSKRLTGFTIKSVADRQEPGSRFWSRAGDHWVETTPSGVRMFHDITGRISLNGCDGDRTRKQDDQKLEMFIPDKDCSNKTLRFRFNNNAWLPFGAITNLH